MAIKWQSWKKTGKTFFNRRLTFYIDAEALEFVVAKKLNPRIDSLITWSKKYILELIENEIDDHGSPIGWYMHLDRIGRDEKEQQKLLQRARLIVKKHFPEAYEEIKE